MDSCDLLHISKSRVLKNHAFQMTRKADVGTFIKVSPIVDVARAKSKLV